MAKAYWVTCYHEVRDAAKLSAYAALAGPAIQAAGARFLARGTAAEAYEAGVKERVVIIEFDSIDAAIVFHDSPAYRLALDALDDGAVRDLRIVAGV